MLAEWSPSIILHIRSLWFQCTKVLRGMSATAWHVPSSLFSSVRLYQWYSFLLNPASPQDLVSTEIVTEANLITNQCLFIEHTLRQATLPTCVIFWIFKSSYKKAAIVLI